MGRLLNALFNPTFAEILAKLVEFEETTIRAIVDLPNGDVHIEVLWRDRFFCSAQFQTDRYLFPKVYTNLSKLYSHEALVSENGLSLVVRPEAIIVSGVVYADINGYDIKVVKEVPSSKLIPIHADLKAMLKTKEEVFFV